MMLIANNVALSVILCLLSIICLPLLGFALRDVEPRDGMPERHSRALCAVNNVLTGYMVFVGICLAAVVISISSITNTGLLWAFLAFTALAAAIVFAWALCNMDSVGAIVLYVISIGLMYLLMHDIMKALGLGILWHMLAICIPIATIGFAVAKYFWDYGKFLEYESAGERGHGYKMFATILYIVTTILLIAAIIFGMIAPKQPDPDQDDQDGDTAATEPSGDGYRQWPWFLNSELQDNDTKADDYYFGYATDVDENKDYQLKDFFSRASYDPFYLEQLVLVKDEVTGSDTNGQILYQGYEERNNVLKRADAATMVLSTNKEVFNNAYEAVMSFYHRATKVEWKKEKDIKNQVYADPDSGSKAPGFILAESEVEEDWCLSFYLEYGKGQTATIMFRHACGWQWVNAAEVLGIEPEQNPIKSGSSSSGGDTPSNPKPNPTEKPSPSPSPTEPGNPYNKDPNKAPKTNTEKNDDPGPGPNTNNGVGSNISAADSQYNSGNSSMKENQNTQEEQKAKNQNSSNTPSTKSNGNVDNPGAGADLSTPVQDSGRTGGHALTDDEDGGDWGSPPD